MITKILRGIRRLFMGSTYHFSTRKGSTSLNGSSWQEIYREMVEYPLKLISIEFLTEKDVSCEYRIVVDGKKIFPFTDCSNMQNGVSRNFLLPINIGSCDFLQIEVRSGINNKNVVIMNELAIIEVH